MLGRFGRNLGVSAVAVLWVTLAAASGELTPEELVFSVQYVGTDYGAAVQGDRVSDEFEYAEMITMVDRVLVRYEQLRPRARRARTWRGCGD